MYVCIYIYIYMYIPPPLSVCAEGLSCDVRGDAKSGNGTARARRTTTTTTTNNNNNNSVNNHNNVHTKHVSSAYNY